jgi:hypothetical protein
LCAHTCQCLFSSWVINHPCSSICLSSTYSLLAGPRIRPPAVRSSANIHKHPSAFRKMTSSFALYSQRPLSISEHNSSRVSRHESSQLGLNQASSVEGKETHPTSQDFSLRDRPALAHAVPLRAVSNHTHGTYSTRTHLIPRMHEGPCIRVARAPFPWRCVC